MCCVLIKQYVEAAGHVQCVRFHASCVTYYISKCYISHNASQQLYNCPHHNIHVTDIYEGCAELRYFLQEGYSPNCPRDFLKLRLVYL